MKICSLKCIHNIAREIHYLLFAVSHFVLRLCFVWLRHRFSQSSLGCPNFGSFSVFPVCFVFLCLTWPQSPVCLICLSGVNLKLFKINVFLLRCFYYCELLSPVTQCLVYFSELWWTSRPSMLSSASGSILRSPSSVEPSKRSLTGTHTGSCPSAWHNHRYHSWSWSLKDSQEILLRIVTASSLAQAQGLYYWVRRSFIILQESISTQMQHFLPKNRRDTLTTMSVLSKMTDLYLLHQRGQHFKGLIFSSKKVEDMANWEWGHKIYSGAQAFCPSHTFKPGLGKRAKAVHCKPLCSDMLLSLCAIPWGSGQIYPSQGGIYS